MKIAALTTILVPLSFASVPGKRGKFCPALISQIDVIDPNRESQESGSRGIGMATANANATATSGGNQGSIPIDCILCQMKDLDHKAAHNQPAPVNKPKKTKVHLEIAIKFIDDKEREIEAKLANPRLDAHSREKLLKKLSKLCNLKQALLKNPDLLHKKQKGETLSSSEQVNGGNPIQLKKDKQNKMKQKGGKANALYVKQKVVVKTKVSLGKAGPHQLHNQHDNNKLDRLKAKKQKLKAKLANAQTPKYEAKIQDKLDKLRQKKQTHGQAGTGQTTHPATPGVANPNPHQALQSGTPSAANSHPNAARKGKKGALASSNCKVHDPKIKISGLPNGVKTAITQKISCVQHFNPKELAKDLKGKKNKGQLKAKDNGREDVKALLNKLLSEDHKW